MIKTDILIVGAGPVGAHAASLFSQKGFRVIVVEKNDMSRCGAQWVNGVPQWQLNEAQVATPPAEEIYHQGGSFSMISPLSDHRITLQDAPLFDLDMRLFGKRLLDSAQSKGNVQILFETSFNHLEFDSNGRPVCANTSKGKIGFDLIIDCSGLAGVVRKQIPLLVKLCPQVSTEDLCTAAQEVREIEDMYGAMSFLERNRGISGEALAWVNISGGFSLLRVQVDLEHRRVAFLTGARPLPGNLSAMNLIKQFVQDNDWVGTKMFGGQRPVPLRRPYATLGALGVALLGDSGCQVYSAHASGIGISLIAAAELSERIAKARDKDQDIGSLDVITNYARQFYTKYGALLANSDASRRFSQGLNKEDTHFLIERRLMTTSMISDSLFQRPIRFSIRDVPSQTIQAISHPRLVQRVLRVAAKVPAIFATIKMYPKEGAKNPERMLKYEQRLERIVSY